MFCNNGKTGRVAVKTVDAAERTGCATRIKITGNGICKRGFVVSHRRMDRHMGRLI